MLKAKLGLLTLVGSNGHELSSFLSSFQPNEMYRKNLHWETSFSLQVSRWINSGLIRWSIYGTWISVDLRLTKNEVGSSPFSKFTNNMLIIHVYLILEREKKIYIYFNRTEKNVLFIKRV